MKIKLLALWALTFFMIGSAHAGDPIIYEINTNYPVSMMGDSGIKEFNFVLPQATTVTVFAQVVDRPLESLDLYDPFFDLPHSMSMGGFILLRQESDGNNDYVSSESNESNFTFGYVGNSQIYKLVAGNYFFGVFYFSGGARMINFQATSPSPDIAAVPEPATYALTLAGLGALGFVARRRKSL